MIDYRGLDIEPVSFGAVSSDNLFDAKEAALFDFYEAARTRYLRALDIGANIGVHTCLMRRTGWLVRAFEPDPEHFRLLRVNLERNRHPGMAQMIEVNRAAVSDHEGEETFVRVLGNTTGSHLKGDKVPYGPQDEFTVPVVDCRPLFAWADFAKIDCEGHEARLLLTVGADCECEFMVEVGNIENAGKIWYHFLALKDSGYRLWAQKSGWQECTLLADVPQHHSEGALFIGKKEPFA